MYAFCCNSLANNSNFFGFSEVFQVLKLTDPIRVIIGRIPLIALNKSMTLKFALFLDSAKMFRRLAIVVLLFYCVHQASGREPQQCSRPNQLTKNVDKFACSKVLPDCCDNNTPEAHCCVIR